MGIEARQPAKPRGPAGVLDDGTQLYESMEPHIQVLFQKIDDGFLYNAINETKGRLDGNYYGTTFVTEGFVRRFFARGEGEVIDYVPKGLTGYQDL